MNETTSLPIVPDSRRDDLYKLENFQQSQLNRFMTGHPFTVMQKLVSAFRQIHPEGQHIYYQEV